MSRVDFLERLHNSVLWFLLFDNFLIKYIIKLSFYLNNGGSFMFCKNFYISILSLVLNGTVIAAMEQPVPVVNREFFGLSATAPVTKYCQILQSYARLLHLQHDLSCIREMSSKADLTLSARNQRKKEDVLEHLQAALHKVDAEPQREFILSQIAAMQSDKIFLMPDEGQICGKFVLFLTTPKAIGTFLAHRSLFMSLSETMPDHNLIKSLLISDDEEVRYIGKILMHQACAVINDQRVEVRSLKDRELVALASSLYNEQAYGGQSNRYVALIPQFFEFYKLMGQVRARMVSQLQMAESQQPSITFFQKGQQQQDRQLIVTQDQQVGTRVKIDESCVAKVERYNIERNIAIVADYLRMSSICHSLYEQTIKELHSQIDIVRKTGKHSCLKGRALFDLIKDYDGERFKDTLQVPTFLDDIHVSRPSGLQETPTPSAQSGSCAASAKHEWIDPSLLRSTAKVKQHVQRKAKKSVQPAPSPTQACIVESVEQHKEHSVVEQESSCQLLGQESASEQVCKQKVSVECSQQPVQSPRETLLDSLSFINPYQDGTVQEVCPEYVSIEDTANRMHIYLFSNESNSRYSQGALRYIQHVNAWFNDARTALIDQGYLDPGLRGRHCALTPEDQLNTVRVHRFSKLVDAHIPAKGISYTKPSRKRAGVADTYIAIPGMIQYMDRIPSRPVQEYCVFVYIIDGQTGACFHRNILFRTNQEITTEFMQKGFYEVEFPPLDPSMH